LYFPDNTGLPYKSVGPGGGSGGSVNIVILPPTNPILNLPEYLKCFTNVGGTDHTYTVTICVQQPVPGSRTPWKFTDGGPIGSSGEQNIVDVGHTFLVFTETYGNTTITRNVGLYPSGGVKPSSPISPGVLNNDEVHNYNISATFTVTSANFFLMLNFLQRATEPGFNYNLNGENCTSFALQTLAQGGINLPNTIGAWFQGSGCNPGDLGEDIRHMTPLSNMTESTITGYHLNAGKCQ
jgi:hypothetical protein